MVSDVPLLPILRLAWLLANAEGANGWGCVLVSQLGVLGTA